MKKVCILATLLVAAASAQAVIIDSSFTNLDFEAGAVMGNPFDGFDSAGQDVLGWQDLNAIVADAGVEAEGAWWSPYEVNSAFMKVGEGAYNLSTYIIQADDEFDVSLMAKGWQTFASTPGAELTVSLFYGASPTNNVIGSFNTGALPQGDNFETWTEYGDTIAATAGSIGQTLGVLVEQTSATADTFGNFDEVSIDVIPEPATIGLFGLAGAAMLLVRRRFMM